MESRRPIVIVVVRELIHVIGILGYGVGVFLLVAFVPAWASELAIHREDGQPTLSWERETGQAYRVESAPDPEAEWTARATLTGDGADLSWADEAGATAQVYRVIAPTESAPFDALQLALERTRRNQRITGAAAAALMPGDGLWIGTAGFSHGSVRVRPQTRFEIGSVTKTMVAAMILRLVEEGQLTLDDSIGQWMPELDHPHIASGITVRQLLNHRGGIYNFGDDIPFRIELFSDWAHYWEPEDVLEYVIEPYFPPGAGGTYSNTGYVLAGMVVRRAAPAGVPAELRRTVFDPAGMRSSFMGAEEGWTGTLAHLHLDFNGDGVHEDLDGNPQTAILSSFWTSGAVVSTAADVARFGAALFDGTLLAPASLEAMRSFQSVDIGGPLYEYGLGLMRFDIDGLEYWAHSGGLFGHYAWFSYCPSTETSLGIVYNYPQTVAGGPSFPVELIRALATAQQSAPTMPAAARSPGGALSDDERLRPERLLGPVGL